MIDEKKLLEKLEELKFANEERGYDTAKDAIQEIINLVNEQPKTDWIPCEVDMPKEHDGYYSELIRRGFKGASYDQCSDVVLVTMISSRGNITITKAQTFDGKWNYEWETKEVGYNKVKEVRTGAKVLAWQPLPQPYKKEGAE